MKKLCGEVNTMDRIARWITAGLFLCLFQNYIPMHAEHISFSFDCLFPSSWCEKALNSSMQVWGNMQVLQKTNTIDIRQEQYDLYMDVILGRMVFAQFCLEHMMQDSQQAVVAEDIIYLNNIMDKIEQTTNKNCNDERVICLKYVVEKIKQVLFSFQSNNTLFSTSKY